ncbi:Cof-type HAD-IIB family hydrolase [Flavisphingomonas formosensis]|uniref:Cof-type HAD-IIB family hydrolase n=1 Tax=Flavisphingomonas formosensis TaxID=861534 RepID=UPI0012FA3E6F|nr:Cof-type HAD-IIB family hydrolase [Sphingomonas formosensis]
MSGGIRLLVSDIDGTLVRHDKSLAEPVIAAVARLQAAGLRLSLISARPPSGMCWIAERLGLDGEIAAFNGATIVTADGRVISADRLDPACAARALALIDAPGVTPWLFADGRWYVRTLDNPKIARERLAANVEPQLVDDFSGLIARVDKIVGVSDDHALLAQLDDAVAAALSTTATVARSQPYYLDVTTRRGNKGDGLAALAQAAGLPLSAVAAIGDQRNDLPMFARAGLSIAMGQGPEEVRAAAMRVTLSNEQDGVAHAIDEIVLPMARREPASGDGPASSAGENR